METELLLSVQQVMDDYIALLREAVPDLSGGVYLHGSLALGAYTPPLSDIDFISVIERRCIPSDIANVRAVHNALLQRHPHAQLSASYLQWQDLGQSEESVSPHPCFHDGVFNASGYHDINAVTWWILTHRGITLLGPPAKQFAICIDWDDLLARMHENLKTYWRRFTTDPRRMRWLLSDYGIHWTVLGVLRQFYTFREHAITSKVGAGLYALDHLPVRWHRLLREAMALREGNHTSLYRSRLVRAASAYAFVHLIITACDTSTTH